MVYNHSPPEGRQKFKEFLPGWSTHHKKRGGFEETAAFCIYKIAYIKPKFSLQLLLLQPHQFYTFSSILPVLQILRKYHLPLQIPVL